MKYTIYLNIPDKRPFGCNSSNNRIVTIPLKSETGGACNTRTVKTHVRFLDLIILFHIQLLFANSLNI